MLPKCECRCCVEYGFPITRKLERDIFWLEIPKNGSSSIKSTYQVGAKYSNGQKIVDFIEENEKLYVVEYDSFDKSIKKSISLFEQEDETLYIVLRDPIVRFISLFNHYFTPKGKRYKLGMTFLKRNKMKTNLNPSQLFNFVIDNLDKITSAEEIHHFYPQTYFIDLTTLNLFKKVNFIDIDNLSSILQTDRTNHTPTSWNIALTDQQITFLTELYKKDYDFFNEIGFKPNKIYETN